MRSRLHVAVLIGILSGVPVDARAQAPTDLKASIDRLSSFDYPTRMNAARQLRRVPRAEVFPALDAAVRQHPDEFVRARALVLMTGFGPSGMSEVIALVIRDRNDRLREIAYRWLEQNPDPRLIPTLLGALNTEQAEFVRPALIRALAAMGADPQVQRALIAESGRGLDFFRSAVIQALGDHKADYAVESMVATSKADGPLQDDALIALGKIGGPVARATLVMFGSASPDLVAPLQAALCHVGDACPARIEVLRTRAESRTVPSEQVRAAIRALAIVASSGDAGAASALIELGREASSGMLGEIAVAFSTVALRRPAFVIEGLATGSDESRKIGTGLLREGFQSLEEDYAKEQFFATARGAYWDAHENSPTRALTATLIDTLEF